MAPKDYLEVARLAEPKIAVTQPSILPLALNEALHVTLQQPIYVCSRGDLWITAPNAPPLEEVVAAMGDEQSHVVRDRVLYVHWAPDADGEFKPMVVRDGTPTGALELVSADQRRPLPAAPYQWDRAISVNERMYVPTDDGMSVLTVEPGYAMKALHQTLPVPQAGAIETPTQFVFDAQGLLVWSPWQNGMRGSNGAMRLLEDTWSSLPKENGWSERPLHLMPLLDGSVLQLSTGEDGKLQLAMLPLAVEAVNEPEVLQLVEQLSDLDAEVREKAFQQLTRYGPGIWPILEKLLPDQLPGTAIRLEQLLTDRVAPTLGGMTLVDNVVQVADWLEDGGLLLHAPAGVQVPRAGDANADADDILAPAWIVIRPGRAVHLLHDAITKDAAPGKQRFFALGDEWIVSDEEIGPRRLLGNHIAPLLRPTEKQFDHVVAIDQRGRWLFRDAPGAAQTLVLDPTIPDPTPRLPVWLMWVKKGTVGWDQNDWPAIKSGGAWVLEEKGWQALDETKNSMITTLPPASTSTPTSAPASAPTVVPATSPVKLPSTPPLHVDVKGNRYYDGKLTLHVIAADGERTVWPLPIEAMGRPTDHAYLVVGKDERIFLMNRPGRILRIQSTRGATDPFELEASFMHAVPNSLEISRFWLDPAGRIAIAYDTERLAILFPDGHVPPEIATMIPSNEMQ